MGRAKMCVDEGDIPNFLAMNGDVLQNREDTTELKGDMEDLRKDVHAIHLKQDAIAKVVTGVQAAISVPIQQLATMADVLKSFVIQSIQCVWPYISMLPSTRNCGHPGLTAEGPARRQGNGLRPGPNVVSSKI